MTCMRQHAALTRVCSSAELLKRLEPQQREALQRSPVHTECVRPIVSSLKAYVFVRASGVSPYGKPFYAISREHDPTVTFFYIPDHQAARWQQLGLMRRTSATGS